ncbi:MAG: hypothetical protein PHV52_00030 [Aliarcobacter sp.]|nr:hypothetical protein [Aliarcobacter sp.]
MIRNMKALDRAIEFFTICNDKEISCQSAINDLLELKKELEEYEQKFNQKEFEYRTQCQNLVSAGRVEADDMPDRLAELEKVILEYHLDKGYEVGVGGWNFKVHIDTFYKWKLLFIMFTDKGKYSEPELIYQNLSETTKEMWDKAIAHFSSPQNEVTDMNNDLPNSTN